MLLLLCRIIQANGFDTPVVLDSPEAAAAAVAAALGIQPPSAPASAQPATQAAPTPAAAAPVPLANTVPEQAADNDSSSSKYSSDLQLQVLVALKSPDQFGGAADADAAAGLEMRPDNVQTWFTKVGQAQPFDCCSGDSPTGDQQQCTCGLTWLGTAVCVGWLPFAAVPSQCVLVVAGLPGGSKHAWLNYPLDSLNLPPPDASVCPSAMPSLYAAVFVPATTPAAL